MKANILFERAAKHRVQMEKALDPINRALAALLDDTNASITYQQSDGWVVLFAEDYNAKVDGDEFDYLLSMSREDALSFLHSRSI